MLTNLHTFLYFPLLSSIKGNRLYMFAGMKGRGAVQVCVYFPKHSFTQQSLPAFTFTQSVRLRADVKSYGWSKIQFPQKSGTENLAGSFTLIIKECTGTLSIFKNTFCLTSVSNFPIFFPAIWYRETSAIWSQNNHGANSLPF